MISWTTMPAHMAHGLLRCESTAHSDGSNNTCPPPPNKKTPHLGCFLFTASCAQCFFYRCRLTTVCRLLNITFVEPNQKDTQCTKYGILHLALCTVYLTIPQTHKSAICNTIRHLCNSAQKSSESGK